MYWHLEREKGHFADFPRKLVEPKSHVRRLKSILIVEHDLCKDTWSYHATTEFEEEIYGEQPPIEHTSAAEEFLARNERIRNALPRVSEKITSTLDDRGIRYAACIDIAKNIEEPEWEALKIEVKIGNLSYSGILDLWTELSKEIHNMLDEKVSRDIYLIMDEE